jgi:predicted O-methyltransferase YrrM
MRRRGCDINWFLFFRDVVAFHESAACSAIQSIKDVQGFRSGVGRLDGSFLYTLVRWVKPAVLVETGTYHGLSTAYIIHALKDNGQSARLYSVDINQSADLSPLLSEEDQNEYLTRIEGDSLDISMGSKLPHSIDFFFHDSVHRYEYQLAEFRAFWPRLSPGGVLASHDVHKNSSFLRFCEETYSHDEQGVADDTTAHSFWGSIASSGFIQKRR